MNIIDIEVVEKFNPYHDKLGRFTTATGAASFTWRTKDPKKQYFADKAIEREKQRTAALDEAESKKLGNRKLNLNQTAIRHCNDQSMMGSIGTRLAEEAQSRVDSFKERNKIQDDWTDEQKEYAKKRHDEYTALVEEYYNDQLSRRAQNPSWVMTGPANYNFKRYEKREEARQKKAAEYEDKLKKFEENTQKKLTSMEPEEKQIAYWRNGKWKRGENVDASDPLAEKKLQAKLDYLTDTQNNMKAANAYYKKHGTMLGFSGFSDATNKKIDEAMKDSWEKKPFASYALTNNNAQIKATQQRLKGLQDQKAKQNSGGGKSSFSGGKIVRNADANRLQLFFDEKPSEEMRAKLKANGFRWAPSQQAWQRQLTPNAERAVERLFGEEMQKMHTPNIMELDIVEKINPYHDPKNGRFTFAPSGAAGGAAVRHGQTAKDDDETYLKAVASGDLATAQRMVDEKAKRVGAELFAETETSAYKIRTKPEPKETVTMYKTFFVNEKGEPSALFVEGTKSLPVGVWLDAQDAYHFQAKNGKMYTPSRKNPSSDGSGKTGAQIDIPNDKVRQELIEQGFLPQGSNAKSVVALAYRPGWHGGDLPFFPQGGKRGNQEVTESGKPNKRFDPSKPKTNYENVHRWNQVVYECEVAADKDYTTTSTIKSGANKGKLKYTDMQDMPTDGYYKFATNPMTNSNDLGAWYISGSMKIVRPLTQKECDDILAKNGFKPQEWEGGTMSLDKLNVNPKKTDSHKKLPDAVTYDDNGKPIPLSQRFDKTSTDVRKSVYSDIKAMSFADIRKMRGSQQETTAQTEQAEQFNIMKADDDKREVFGWALVAIRKDGQQIVDHQNDIVDPDELESAAYEYVLNFRDAGELHNQDLRKKGKLIESVVFTKEKMQAMGIPEGTVPEGWWVGFKIEDDNAWQHIKNGRYRMFSIEGRGIRQPVEE